jgi:hypothetical protein
LFVDGLSLKFVQLSLKGRKLTLRDFKTVALVKKFEEKEMVGEGEEAAAFGDAPASTDAFGGGASMEAGQDEEANSNSTVLLGLLSDLNGKHSLSYALSEPAVTYQEFESDFGLKGMALRKRIVEELAASRATPPALDSITIIPHASGGLLTVIREDGLNLYDLLTEIRGFLGNNAPNLGHVDSADVALIEMIRTNYEVQDEEVTVVVYVGHDFSRIIFMQGKEYLHFAPIISEGHESPNLENTLYSRILLEQDNIALARMDRIILAGEAHKVNLLESLAPQFSSAQVEYAHMPNVDLTPFDGSVGEALSEYAIPLMNAWKALEPKRKSFFDTNLIPAAIVEAQKVFKLAWHGWIMALAIIGSIVFFYNAILEQGVAIRRAKEELDQKQLRLADLDLFRSRKDVLQGDINRYINATTTYDSIAPGGDRWSRILHYVATSVEDLNSMWIYHIRPDPQNKSIIILSGRSIYRTRIPRIASIFERATLREVRTTTVRNKIVYEFDIVVERVDRHDIPERPFDPNRR